MKPTATTSVLLLSMLIFIILVLVAGVSFLRSGNFLSTNPRAQNQENITSNTFSLPQCPLRINIHVKEATEDGEEILLQMSDVREDDVQWGFVDALHTSTGDRKAISFNHDTYVQYSMYASELSFVPFPEVDEVYEEGSNTFVRFLYNQNNFDILRKEVIRCNSTESEQWLCKPDLQENLDTISGITLKCNMDLDLGWVVLRKSETVQNTSSFSKNRKAVFKTCDLNDDSACNTIDLLIVLESYGKRGSDTSVADLNNDSRVDALDYTIVFDQVVN